MHVTQKWSNEVIPLTFFFAPRLGGLAKGATITEVLELGVTPTGDSFDLSIGNLGDAQIDPVTNLAVQVIAERGLTQRVYQASCTATVVHAGNSYTFTVILPVKVL